MASMNILNHDTVSPIIVSTIISLAAFHNCMAIGSLTLIQQPPNEHSSRLILSRAKIWRERERMYVCVWELKITLYRMVDALLIRSCKTSPARPIIASPVYHYIFVLFNQNTRTENSLILVLEERRKKNDPEA